MKINQATIDLIKSFEGCRLDAYADIVGVWTIGYGLTAGALEGVVVSRGMVITQAQADAYLAAVLEKFGESILRKMTRKPTDNQFGAMLSLAYNIGVGAFIKSTCLKRFNAGDMEGAAEALTWFNKAGGKVVRGLVRRREAERDLFLSGVAEPVAVKPDALRESHAASTTMQATAATIGSGAGAAITAISSLDGIAQYIVLGFAGVIVLAGLWIMRERIRKWAAGDR